MQTVNPREAQRLRGSSICAGAVNVLAKGPYCPLVEAATPPHALAAGAPRFPRLLRGASDEHLVKLLRAGNDRAFEAIYDRHHAHILSFCRHMLGSREDAEDATQQTFISAHRGLVESDKPIHLRAWLYAIARNRCVSILRGHHQTRSLEAEGAEGLAVTTEGLAEVVQRREDLRELVVGLAGLPERQRSALVLFELGDLSQGQIADILECDANQVKALVFQARTALMNEREARAMDCGHVRVELANARGSARLQGPLRRHVRSCEGCREFATHVRRQRANLALVLPAVPAAGLRAATMGATVGAHAGWSAGSGGGMLTLVKGALSKAILAAAVAGVGTGAAVAVLGHSRHRTHAGGAHAAARPRPPAAAAWASIPTRARLQVERRNAGVSARRHHARHHHHAHPGAAALGAPAGLAGSQAKAGSAAGAPASAHRVHPGSSGHRQTVSHHRATSGPSGRGHRHGAGRGAVKSHGGARGVRAHRGGPGSSAGRGNGAGHRGPQAANPGGRGHGAGPPSASPGNGASSPAAPPAAGGQGPPGQAKQGGGGGGGNGGGHGPAGTGPPGQAGK